MEKKIDWKRPDIFTVIITLVTGIMVHFFGLVNVLQNYDNIIVQPSGYGIALHSGRWSLYLFAKAVEILFGTYNLPWLNGVLFIVFVAMTAGVIVSAFDITCRKTAALIGIVFITFPSAASTLFFRYTAHYDAFALLLAVLAVWFLEKHKYGIIPAAISISLSLGIYQAYVPVTISMFVLLLIKQVLAEDVNIKRVILHGIYACAALLLGLALYFIILKFCLFIRNTSLLPYQGINEMGNISLSQLPLLIKNAFLGSCTFPITGYASIAQIGLLKIAYCILGIVIIATIAYIAIAKKKNPYQVALLVLLCLTFPVAVDFFKIMCPNSTIYSLMVYSFALIPCVPLILNDTLSNTVNTRKKLQRILAILAVCVVLLIVLCNTFLTNVNYTAAYYATCQTENYINSIVTQVRMTEGFTPERKWVLLGNPNDPLLFGTWNRVPTYGGVGHSSGLVSQYGFENWIRLYHGYALPWASEEETAQLSGDETVKNMPVWPSAGSIKVIDDYVVIKFEETQNP